MPRTMNTYISYNFGVKEKDPIIDRMRTLLDDEQADYQDVHEKSGVATSTLYNWFYGKTRRPQFATVMAVARGLGYDLTLTKKGVVVKFQKRKVA